MLDGARGGAVRFSAPVIGAEDVVVVVVVADISDRISVGNPSGYSRFQA